MTVEEILEEVHAQPFRPFVLHLASGRNVQVQHPDFFARNPRGGSITVYSPEGGREVIDPQRIAGLTTDLDDPKGRNGQ